MARHGGRALLRPDTGGGRDERSRPAGPAPRPAPYEEVWILEDVDGVGAGVLGDLGDAGDPGEGDDRGRVGRSGGHRGPLPSAGAIASDARVATASGARAASDGAGNLPSEVVDELTGAVGTARGEKLAARLAAAVRAYERDRYQDAMRTTRVLVEEVPESGAARELHGLVCYRLGRWRDAIRHLTVAAELQGDDPSQLPVLMDCHRALGHHRRVAELWDELRVASPDPDVVVEGRLVLAADLAEQDRLADGIDLLVRAGAARDLRKPSDRHVRQWYVLADLCERAGDIPRARELFARVAATDPDMADAGQRLAALGPAPATGGGRRSTVTLGEIAKAAKPGSGTARRG